MKSLIVKTIQHWITKLAERRKRFSYRIQDIWMNYVNVVSGGTGCLNWARPGLWGREADQGICLSLPGANPHNREGLPHSAQGGRLGEGNTRPLHEFRVIAEKRVAMPSKALEFEGTPWAGDEAWMALLRVQLAILVLHEIHGSPIRVLKKSKGPPPWRSGPWIIKCRINAFSGGRSLGRRE